MQTPLRFLIVDAYPKTSRDEFDAVGMKQAWRLFAEMLVKHLPEAVHTTWFAGDHSAPPGGLGPDHYAGILWTGSDLTIYHRDDERVTPQIEFAQPSFKAGTHESDTSRSFQM